MRGVFRLRPAGIMSACAVAASLAAAPLGAQTVRPVANHAAAYPPCKVASERASLASPLVRTARKLAANMPVKVVALGSSSTYGFGASSPAASYPSRLAEDLALRLPGRPITVLNRGRNNDEVAQTLARLDRDVIAEQPDLILWQIGTNALLWNMPLQPSDLQHGLSRMKAAGADVVLIDPQFAPRVIPAHNAERMVSLVASIAATERVGVFQRYALMRHWHETEHLPLHVFLSKDGLHMNDWSYACLGKWIGTAIVGAAALSVAALAEVPTALH